MGDLLQGAKANPSIYVSGSFFSNV